MHNEREKGFTLIEVLVGISILVVITAALYSSFISVLKIYKNQEEINYVDQNIRTAMYSISRNIRNIFTSCQYNEFIGTEDKIVFTSYLPKVKSSCGGLSRIAYYIDNDPDTPEEGLIMEDFGFPVNLEELKEGKKTELAPLVKSIKFRYSDGSVIYDEWSNKPENGIIKMDGIPSAVEVEITVNIEKQSSIKKFITTVPVFVTN